MLAMMAATRATTIKKSCNWARGMLSVVIAAEPIYEVPVYGII
jgi:hypothetical protein